jgi:3-deoxy-manno-octulosonate cytidylyltransferase (CMP-KDO synthetase)
LAATVVIPARLGSTRFPAKILASETGKPLVQHVVDQVRRCKRVREVLVATDDERVVKALAPFGTRCVMTSPHHQSGTDRIAEVARGLTERGGENQVLVNVQGDEPEIEPETVDALVAVMESADADMATVATPFPPGADPADPNLVKVVFGVDGRALYFSRSPVPFYRDGAGAAQAAAGSAAYYLHLGIYAYRRRFLLEFAAWPQTPMEKAEKLEQLRALEHGRSIKVVTISRAAHGIDTPAQYAEFVKRQRLKQGPT